MRRLLAQPWGPYYTVGESLLMLAIGTGAIAMTLGVAIYAAY